MFRLFNSDATPKQGSSASSSWFVTPAFLNTSWMNPFGGASLPGLKRTVLTSMVLMQHFQGASAESNTALCFYQTKYNILERKHGLHVLWSDDEVEATKQLFGKQDGEVKLADCHRKTFALYSCNGEHDYDFGSFPKVFLFTHCTMKYYSWNHATEPLSCVIDSVEKSCGPLVSGNRPDDDDERMEFALSDPMLAVYGSSIFLALSICYSIMPVCRPQVRAVRDLEAGLEPVDVRDEKAIAWENLLKRLNALAEQDAEETQALLESYQAIDEDYRCQITFTIMSDPVTLLCRHSVDKDALVQWMKTEIDAHRDATCPCCRDKIEPVDVKTNEMMKAAIEMKYKRLDRETTELDKCLNPVFHSLRSSGSSSFYSVASSPRDSGDEGVEAERDRGFARV